MDVHTKFVPLSVFSDNPLYLSPEESPNGQWSEKHGNYNSWWAAYKGYELSKRADSSVDAPLVYPFKLNMVRSSALIHSAGLLGQFEDRIVQFGISTTGGIKKDIAEKTSRMLNVIWALSGGDASMMEQAIFQQVFGGFYYQTLWSPNRKKWPILHFAIDPRAVFPIWDGYNYDRLVAVDVMHQIPKPVAAARYSVNQFRTVNSETVSVHEHWNEVDYFVEVDGKVARWRDGTQMAGKNPFIDPVLGYGIVPFSYAPRVRAGDFYGDSLVPSIVGPQAEINDAIASLNDGLRDAMYQTPIIRNAPKGTQNVKNQKSRLEWLNLGMTQFGGDKPEAFRLEGAKIDQAMVDMVMKDLFTVAREHNGAPDVAWGRTDSSIRSALVLSFMMKPFNDLARHYRTHARTALKRTSYNTLVMAFNKKEYLPKDMIISDKHIEAVLLGHRVSLPPVLPQDRIDLVNEVVQRISSNTISVESAVRRLDGDDMVEDELERIETDAVEAQARAIKTAQQTAKINGVGSVVGAPKKKKDDKNPPKDNSNRAQAEGGLKSS